MAFFEELFTIAMRLLHNRKLYNPCKHFKI